MARVQQWQIVLVGVLACVAAPAWSAGEVVTVTTRWDVTDLGGARRVEDLPGPDGLVSFREACQAVNNTAGPQTIAFAVPQSEWAAYDNTAVLWLEFGYFGLTDDETTIDCTTQTAFTGDTNPNGNEVSIYGAEPNAWGVAAIWIFGNDCVVRGLDRVWQRGYGVEIWGDNNRVIGCTIAGPWGAAVRIGGSSSNSTVPTGNVIGGTAEGEGNRLDGGGDGVRVDPPAGPNLIVGNQIRGSYGGVVVYAAPQYGLPIDGIQIGGPTEQERNIIAGSGHYGSEGAPDGVQVEVIAATNTLVQGNYIGTTVDGSAAADNDGPVGVAVRYATNTTIRDNLISGMVAVGTNHYAGQRFGAGISIMGAATNTHVYGNLLGTDVTGTSPIPNRVNVSVAFFPGSGYPADTFLGAAAPGTGNLLAYSESTGVVVSQGVNGVRIRGNRIFANTALGIDLLGSANGSQAAPVITAAVASGGLVTLSGTLMSAANQAFALDFFLSAACDPSGFGEGERFIGTTEVTTGANGVGGFEVTLPAATHAGDVATATATRVVTGSTSEFSACRAVEMQAPLTGDMDCSGVVDFADINPFVLALTGGYDAAYPDCRWLNGDIDGNGTVDFGDINPFVALLTQ